MNTPTLKNQLSTLFGYNIFILGYFALYNRLFTAYHDCQI